MADEVVVESGESPEDFDVVFVKDGEVLEEQAEEEKPAGRQLSEEEYAELVKKGDSSNALVAPLSSLVEKMQAPQQPANVQLPGESDEDFWKRVEEQAFVPGQFRKAMTDVQQRAMAPILGQYASVIMKQAKQLMRVDPERGTLFRKYEKEIDQEYERIPPQQRHPDVYNDIYERVMVRHQPEMMQEERTKLKDELKAEILKEYGIDPNKDKPVPGVRVQSLNQRAGAPNAEPRSQEGKALRIFESERDRMVSIGMDPKDPDQVRSYLNSHPRRK